MRRKNVRGSSTEGAERRAKASASPAPTAPSDEDVAAELAKRAGAELGRRKKRDAETARLMRELLPHEADLVHAVLQYLAAARPRPKEMDEGDRVASDDAGPHRGGHGPHAQALPPVGAATMTPRAGLPGRKG